MKLSRCVSAWTWSTVRPVSRAISSSIRRWSARISRARISTSVAWPSKPLVCPWWIMILALGSAIRFPFAPPARSVAPIDIAIPKQIVATSQRTYCIAS